MLSTVILNTEEVAGQKSNIVFFTQNNSDTYMAS